ncbi:MAG: hypothetical protein RLZZ546_2559 [Bacteroidota bacterium]|jgi:copper homeostasis protein
MYKTEFCTDNVHMAIKYQSKVDQIEFCSFLDKDGLTPTLEDIKVLTESIKIPLKVMIRSRDGNFQYKNEEMKQMIRSAKEFINLGINRFVFGSIKNNRMCIDQVTEFAAEVFPSKVCVHKAIDVSTSILEDTQLLLKIENVNEILSSGGADTAMNGKQILKQMLQILNGKIDLIAAGKITYKNINEIDTLIGAPLYHGKNIIKVAI